jgi:hypothetical protein
VQPKIGSIRGSVPPAATFAAPREGQTAFQKGLSLGFVGCTFAVATTNRLGDRWSYFMLGATGFSGDWWIGH